MFVRRVRLRNYAPDVRRQLERVLYLVAGIGLLSARDSAGGGRKSKFQKLIMSITTNALQKRTIRCRIGGLRRSSGGFVYNTSSDAGGHRARCPRRLSGCTANSFPLNRYQGFDSTARQTQ